MKRRIICIALVLSVCFFASCGKSSAVAQRDSSSGCEDTQDTDRGYNLIVNGQVISSDKELAIHREEQYADIPLTATLRALGCQVEWGSQKRVEITYNDTVYILNPSKKTLKKRGDSVNLIAVMPGATHGVYCEAAGEEVIIDSDSVSYFLYVLGFEISVDYTDTTITVRKKPPADDSRVDFSEWAKGKITFEAFFQTSNGAVKNLRFLQPR